ncbi:porin [Kushneria indalinina]|uniref:Putative porin n=1 Tax=Kushneria indalinina DSM 14324 TaxID=1122140 RepID=A0A3D9DUA2_9GAMM|nr:porin [Kushneria indalinina]REC94343.1 putative porin [Kushneria indalinina DSM 14324]
MKKTLLATAIAGALGTMAAGAQAATVYNQDGSKLDVYGNVQLGLRSQKNYDNSDADSTSTATSATDDLFDNGSTIGFRGEHIISPDLTGYFRAEFEFSSDQQKGYYADGGSNSDASGLSKGDQAYLGLTGDFGDVRVGSWDALIDDWVDDPVSNNEYFDLTRAQNDVGGTEYEGNKITYTSPILSGLQFAVGTQYSGDNDDALGRFNYDAPTGENSYVIDDDSSASLFGGLRYMVADWTFAAVYDNLKNFQYINSAGDQKDYGELYGLNATWQMSDDLRIAAKAERMSARWASDANVDRYGIGARYSYGNGDLYGAYQYVRAEENGVRSVEAPLWRSRSEDGNQSKENYNEFILGATYNLSSQMYVWLEGGKFDRENDQGDGIGTGIAYSF